MLQRSKLTTKVVQLQVTGHKPEKRLQTMRALGDIMSERRV